MWSQNDLSVIHLCRRQNDGFMLHISESIAAGRSASPSDSSTLDPASIGAASKTHCFLSW